MSSSRPTGELFSSRWALVLATLGMAIGTGNIWRFPRVAAENGGGAFLIPWLLFLFLWSIPLLMVEFAMGKTARQGVLGAFGKIVGGKYIWMGCFVAFCTSAIMFYYSVVTGWAFKYAAGSVSGGLWGSDGKAYWEGFLASGWQPIVFHGAAIIGTAWIVSRGVIRGIERANRILIPALIGLLIVMAVKVLTLPGAANGLEFLFRPDFEKLKDYEVWLAALSQSAWSTGAGWGLLLTYAAYMRSRDDIAVNAFLCGLGNNSASLLAAIVIVPTVFALVPGDAAAMEVLGAGNEGLAFIWIPNLFQEMPAGRVFMPVFFCALAIAAISSLIAMVELATRVFVDFGCTRRRAIVTVASLTFLCGIPSALNMDVFQNQDWVWGLGLMVSGAFFAFAAIRFGVERIRVEIINTETADMPIGRWFTLVVTFLVPIEFVVMLTWWLVQAAGWEERWADPFRPTGVGTCFLQWGVVLITFLVANGAIRRKLEARSGAPLGEEAP